VPTPHSRHIKAWSKSTRQQGIHSSTHATWPNRDRSIKLSATGINLLQVSRHLYLTVLVVLIIIHILCRFGRFHSVYACISLGLTGLNGHGERDRQRWVTSRAQRRTLFPFRNFSNLLESGLGPDWCMLSR
jgi:hypothetical protein